MKQWISRLRLVVESVFDDVTKKTADVSKKIFILK